MSKFKPGKSGNPAGRPPGIPSPTAKLRQAIAGEMPEIINVLIKAAKGGDTQAASLLLSRALPPLRPDANPQKINCEGESISQQAASISASALSGEISTSTAADMMAILQGQARIVEFEEIEKRLAAIEERMNGK